MAQSVQWLSYGLDGGEVVFFFFFSFSRAASYLILLHSFRIDSSSTRPYVHWVPRIISLGVTANGV